MSRIESFFEELYNHFNERNIEGVVAHTTDDVRWANGMEGGYVYGHDGLRNYWTRQFAMIKPTVTPVDVDVQGNVVHIKVHQVVKDLDDNLLMDEVVGHTFSLNSDNKVVAFEIDEK